MRGVELALITAGIASGHQVFLLKFKSALGVLALAAKYVTSNKSKRKLVQMRVKWTAYLSSSLVKSSIV